MWKSKIYVIVSNLTYFSSKCFIIHLDTRRRLSRAHPHNSSPEFPWTFTTLSKFIFLLDSGTLALPSPGNITYIDVHTYHWKSNWKFLHPWSFAYQVEVWWLACVSSVSISYLFICWLVNSDTKRGTLYTKQLFCRYMAALCQTFLQYELLELQQLQEKSASLHQHWVMPHFTCHIEHIHVLLLVSCYTLMIYTSSSMNLMANVACQHSAGSKGLRTAASMRSFSWAQMSETAWGELHV